MSDVPKDRAPNSLRVVNYDPKNAIHTGLVSRQHPNAGKPVNSHIEARTNHIVMPVSSGNEAEPKLSGRHMTNEEHDTYEVPEEHAVNLSEEAKKLPQSLKDKASAPKKKVAPKSKPALQTESQKATSKEELRKQDIERRNAALRKK